MQKLAEKVVLHTKDDNAYILTEETALWHKFNAVANIDKQAFEVTDNDKLVELDRELNALGLVTEYRKFKDPITFSNTDTDKLYHYIFVGNQK